MDVTIAASQRPASASEVILGIDTHLKVHVAVALDGLGRHLGELNVPTTVKGYQKLLHWAEGFGPVYCAGVEGTGSYGAGLARYLKAAARAVLADDTVGEPKSGDGQAEMIRILISARQSAMKARTQAANQLQALLVSAPEDLRHRLRELPTKNLVDTCARLRPGAGPNDVHTATKFALRSVARRYQLLSEEITELDEQLDRLVADAAPKLTALPGIGTDHAATLLTVAGDNPQRLKSEASFASLCGVSPIEASSGKVVRHRLNRGGDRDANRCLHLICVVRMRHDRRTREYVARRTAEGKSKREIMRCLKRYIAREIYRVLAPMAAASSPTALGSQAAYPRKLAAQP